jgi:anti-sigma regulatory factor (Ser/Thr protein kinase)
MAKLLGISPAYVRRLADEGILPFRRTAGGHRVFEPEATASAFAKRAEGRSLRLELPIAGLEEHRVWRQLEAELPPRRANAEARSTAHYGFTEMLNNAIDHSGGSTVVVIWRPGREVIRVEVDDDGVGVFERIRLTLGLPDHITALEELSKGKLTTQPERHSGEGIFFTSLAVDLFDLRANNLRWTVDNRRNDVALGEVELPSGTQIRFEVDAQTTRRLQEVFERFTDEELRFNRSRGIVKLFQHGAEFVSRSEAKRLMTGFERFAEVDIDFTGVDSVGQGFADEVFRVWATDHPDVRLTPSGMNPAVALMIGRAVAAAADR